jgi:hypothetical protein
MLAAATMLVAVVSSIEGAAQAHPIWQALPAGIAAYME